MITKDMAKVSLECLSLVKGTAHTLIAGTTGSGKSVLLNTILYSMIKKSLVGDDFGLLFLIDTKRVELKQYKDYIFTKGYVTEPEDVPAALDGIIEMMDGRYYNMPGKETTDPHVYIVIDELADVLTTRGVLDRIIKIGRLGRAAHIHLLCCTQDPSRYTLSAQLVQNFTTRVALHCADSIESKQIINVAGAEDLPDHGKAIVRDKKGRRMIDIPLTPDEDIDELMESVKQLCEDYFVSGIESPTRWIDQDLAAFIEGRPFAEINAVY